jgi:AraC-like DNA-binding protein
MLLMRAEIDAQANPHRTRHRHVGHELLVMDHGRGSQLTVRGQEPCATGDVFIFPAGQPHMSYAAAGESFACLVLQTDPGDLADGTATDGGARLFAVLAEHATSDNRLRVRPATKTRMRGLLARALEEWQSPRTGSRCAARALVMEALVTLSRDPSLGLNDDTDPAAEHHIESARRWIDQYWMQPIRIADLVALGSLERSQFLARFRASTGTTVGAALLATRLREAKHLLAESDASMLDIALGCGFGSQSHFNHRFRNAENCSPRAWRRRQLDSRQS